MLIHPIWWPNSQSFRSWHPQGLNLAMADGSVKFISEGHRPDDVSGAGDTCGRRAGRRVLRGHPISVHRIECVEARSASEDWAFSACRDGFLADHVGHHGGYHVIVIVVVVGEESRFHRSSAHLPR
jgi:hypothetical protein